jgi:hypothetical protein
MFMAKAHTAKTLSSICVSLCVVLTGAGFVYSADDNEWIPPVIKSGIPITGFGVFNGDPCYYSCKTVSTIYRFDFGPDSPSKPYLLATDGFWPTIDTQGGRIAYAAVSSDEESYRICIMDSDGENPRYIPDVTLSSFTSMSWTEDGRILLYGTPSSGANQDKVGFYLYDLDGQEYYLGTSERGEDLVVRGEYMAWTGPGLATWNPQSPEGSMTDYPGSQYFDESRNHSPAIPPSQEHVIFNFSILSGFEHYYLDNMQEASDQFKPIKAARYYTYCENYVSQTAGADALDQWLMFVVIKPSRAEENNTLPQVHVLDRSSKRVYLLTHEFDSIPANPSFWIGDNSTEAARPVRPARHSKKTLMRKSVPLERSSTLPHQILITPNARDPRSHPVDIRGRHVRPAPAR